MISYVASALLAVTAFGAGGATPYDYKQNGADWGDLEGYGLCKTGKEQSPIDLNVDVDVSDTMKIVGYNYENYVASAPYTSKNRAWTNNYLGSNRAELETTLDDGTVKSWEPLQFHFHAPSEHSVDGKLYDAEVHVVHYVKGTNGVDADGNSTMELGSVVGVFFDREAGGNEENPFLTSFFNSVDNIGENGQGKIELVNFLQSVDMSQYWNYPGSLTTPPCTEGILWNVMKNVQPISDAQLERFTKYLADDADFAEGKGNNRVVQNWNDRMVCYSGASSLLSAGAAILAVAAAFSF